MFLIIAINIAVVAGLVYLTVFKGLEKALPFFVFVLVFTPNESQIQIPGLFNLTTWRVAIVTFTVLYFLFKNSGDPAKPLLSKTPLRILIALHVLWCLASTVYSVFPFQSIKQVLTFAIEYYLLYYMLTQTITSLETVHKILAAMVIGVAFASVFGWVEAYYPWRLTNWFPAIDHYFMFGPSEEGRGDRIISTFSNYSLFGAAISFAIIEVFYFLQSAKGGLLKFGLWATLILMFWVDYKTTTRGPWMAVIIGAVLLLLCCPGRTRKSMLVIAALCVAVFIIRPGVWDTTKNLYLNTIDVDNPDNEYAASYEYRWKLWEVGQREMAKGTGRQILGYGLGTFFDLHIVGEFNGNPNYVFTSCDEAWVQQMVETGYPGLVIIFLVLTVPALLALRNTWKLPPPYKYLSWILFINMLQYYFMMTNVAIYGWGQTGYMLWTWIAISMLLPALAQKEPRPSLEAAPEVLEMEPQPVGGPW